LGATGLVIDRLKPQAAPWKLGVRVIWFVVAVVCLWWVVRGIDFNRLWSEILHVHSGWLALAVMCDVLGYVVQGIRWRLLLVSVGDLPVLTATKFIYAGLFANEVLPLRPGEILRGWLAAREMSVSPLAIAPSILVERLIDGVWLTVGLLLLAHFVPLPTGLSRAVDLFSIAMMCLVAMAAVSRPAFAYLEAVRRWHIFGNLRFVPGSLPVAGAWLGSAVMLILQAFSFWFMMSACRIGLSWNEALGVLLVVRIGTLVPGAPANLGTYQLAVVLGLMLFGMSKDVAAPFSVILFAALTAPLWILGAGAIAQTGVSLSKVRRGAAEWGHSAV